MSSPGLCVRCALSPLTLPSAWHVFQSALASVYLQMGTSSVINAALLDWAIQIIVDGNILLVLLNFYMEKI